MASLVAWLAASSVALLVAASVAVLPSSSAWSLVSSVLSWASSWLLWMVQLEPVL